MPLPRRSGKDKKDMSLDGAEAASATSLEKEEDDTEDEERDGLLRSTMSSSSTRSGKSAGSSSAACAIDTMKVFYINVTVDDASLAVFDKVHSTLVDDKKLPGPKKFRKAVGKVIANKAASSIPPKAIAKKLSVKIPKLLMYKTAEKGLKLYAETVFLEKTYFVIQIQVQHVNSTLLLESVAGDDDKVAGRAVEKEDDDDDESDDDDDSSSNSSVETSVLDEWLEKQEKEALEQASSPYVVTSRLDVKAALSKNSALSRSTSCPVRWIDWLLSKISLRYRKRLESQLLPTMIQMVVTNRIHKMMKKKMAEKNLVARTKVLPETEQARYFFDRLKQVRNPSAES